MRKVNHKCPISQRTLSTPGVLQAPRLTFLLGGGRVVEVPGAVRLPLLLEHVERRRRRGCGCFLGLIGMLIMMLMTVDARLDGGQCQELDLVLLDLVVLGALLERVEPVDGLAHGWWFSRGIATDTTTPTTTDTSGIPAAHSAGDAAGARTIANARHLLQVGQVVEGEALARTVLVVPLGIMRGRGDGGGLGGGHKKRGKKRESMRGLLGRPLEDTYPHQGGQGVDGDVVAQSVLEARRGTRTLHGSPGCRHRTEANGTGSSRGWTRDRWTWPWWW